MGEKTVRLDKYLANLGVSSRRHIKSLLKDRMLTVNGERMRESGFRLDPRKDIVLIDGKKIAQPELVYFLLNKPLGTVSTTSDEYGRKNILSLIPTKERIYPIGRLDKDTSGLILLTNDGELTNLLTHPRYHVPKVYRLIVRKSPTREQMQAFRTGVLLEDGITAPAGIKNVSRTNAQTTVEVTLHEGRNRQIRRMCETVGLELLALERIQFGSLKLGTVKTGKYRNLTIEEVRLLKREASKQQPQNRL